MKRQAYTEFQQVIPNLYIGGQISSLNLTKLNALNIKRVLRVNGITQNMLSYDKHGIDHRILDIDDMPDFQIDKFFDESNSFIEGAIAKGQGCLVVCTAGISRSAAIVMSYLIKERKMPYQMAYTHVKQARYFIQPNPGFVRILQNYAAQHSCELCDLEKKTHWFDQYAKKRFNGR